MKNDDRAIWSRYAKGVKRLRGGKQEVSGGKAAEKVSGRAVKTTAAGQTAAASRGRKTKETPPPSTLDARNERKLRRGEIALEARLDLHGMTQNEAYNELVRFVGKQAAQGKRRLLVITGKGSLGRAPLRANLPRWCGSEPMLTENILALRPAAPKHGGDGAWYVLLRRRKNG